MEKWVKWSIGLVILTFLIAAGFFSYILFLNGEKSNSSNSGIQLANPAANLSLEEAVAQFNESFVYYLLYNIGANKLHKSPFGSEDPRLEIVVSDDTYSAIVTDGNIKVSKSEIEDEDIILKTTKEEAVKMMKDRKYIEESFKSGNSGIELVANKAILFAKGYLGLYDELKTEAK